MSTQTQMKPDIVSDLREGIEEAASHYPTRRSAIMPALHLAQQRYGTLTNEVLAAVANILTVPEIWVFEAVTFYSMFHTEPVGRFHIQLCNNVSCLLTDAQALLGHLEGILHLKTGETTDDGLFTLSTVECIGACDKAPVLMINDVYHNNVTLEGVDLLINELREEAGK